jgi:hypothetical protein
MNKKAIPNSPGYYITNTGVVYNENGKCMKTWFSTDGYERIRLTSIEHGKRVNRTVHLLVAEAFLNGGKYTDNKLQVNHISGIKANNKVSNLELATQTENVNHAHNNELYTYNIIVKLYDMKLDKAMEFRSLRELSRYLNVSMNYIRPRIIISNFYPMYNRYKLDIDYKKYIDYISTIKNNKVIYVYSYITDTLYTLTAYVQISILFGMSYITVGKILNKYPDKPYYVGGYIFSLNKLNKPIEPITKQKALEDRDVIWKKLAMSVNNVGLK